MKEQQAMRNDIKRTVQDNILIPDYVQACADAVCYDLMYGPTYARIPYGNIENFTRDDYTTIYEDVEEDCVPECGDRIESVYTGSVGQALRDFIEDLPSECWVDTDCDCYMTREPESYEFIESDISEEDCAAFGVELTTHNGAMGYWQECNMESVYRINQAEIVESLFGKVISREFR
jgi:hypothetical protein